MLFYFLSIVLAEFTEDRVKETSFESKDDLQNLRLENIVLRHDQIILRSLSGENSLINFKNENPNEEWSFEFTFNDLDIPFPQKAGIFLWYTKEKQKKGTFYGANGKFEGIMVGLEFLGKSLEILIAGNDGEQDIEALDDLIVIKDSPDPERFKNVKHFKVKVISTENNFKVEIYDKDKLVYDNLRFFNINLMKDRKLGKFFSITSSYSSKVPEKKRFILESAKLFKRTETELYDPQKINSEQITNKPRFYDEIEHQSLEVQHLISNLEHFMKYIKVILGTPIGSTIVETTQETKVTVLKQELDLKNLNDAVNDIKKEMKNNSLSILNGKLHDMETQIKNIHLGQIELKKNIFDLEKEVFKQFRRITVLLIAILASVIIIPIINTRRKLSMNNYKKN